MRIGPVYYPTGRYLRTKAAALIDQAERSKLSLARKREKESRDRGDPIVRANDKVRNQRRLIASRRIGKSRGVFVSKKSRRRFYSVEEFNADFDRAFSFSCFSPSSPGPCSGRRAFCSGTGAALSCTSGPSCATPI